MNPVADRKLVHTSGGKKWMGVVLVSLMLAACGGEEFEDLQEFVRKSGEELRGQVDPPPEIKPYEPFAYDNSAQLPDPFKPKKQDERKEPSTAGAGGLNEPDRARPKQELESFALETLKMVGFLHKGKVSTAVIRSTEGKVYQVKVGNYIGLNFGQIKSITETEVKIREMVQDGTGDWVERDASLQLVE